jgi:hypothetical protein
MKITGFNKIALSTSNKLFAEGTSKGLERHVSPDLTSLTLSGVYSRTRARIQLKPHRLPESEC